ncbi:MAG: beta-N-acetylhexosaminidase [Saprospiraceae bacterium]|nr:beta-N-acetylhexosaminidase [Saprospiraceae bacterium]
MRITFIFFLILNQFIVNSQSDLNRDFPIIPKPKSIRVVGGNYSLNQLDKIIIPTGSLEAEQIANSIREILQIPILKLNRQKKIDKPSTRSLTLSHIDKPGRDEYYKISITKNGIWLQGSSAKAWFLGMQTLSQLYELNSSHFAEKTLPYCLIEDEPRFKYRGMHLDVSRHFYPVESIKKYLRLMARFKFNTFHWHLTDDQGWRIEIKKFPKLQEISSSRKATLKGHASQYPEVYDSSTYHYYYTQQDISEIVDYASKLYIDVIPEIEMPGHSTAALAAYPEFSCNGELRDVACKWGVFNSGVYCTQDTTIWFLKEILNEVCNLFPGKYIHIGGDEVPKENWKACEKCQAVKRRQNLKTEEDLQSYFLKNIEKHLSSKGKTLVGWDEILEGGLPANAVVMSWRGNEGGIHAARKRHEVIMCPGSHCYFDHYQSLNSTEPLAIGGYTSLEKTYHFEPVPTELKANERSYVLGAQGNVWTEYMPDFQQVLYMAYPRAIALSEVNWTAPDQKNYPGFLSRLGSHIPWFKKEEMQITQSMLDLSYQTRYGEDGIELSFNKPAMKGKILVESTREGDVVGEYLTHDTFILHKDVQFKAWYQLEDGYIGKPLRITFQKHLGVGKQITLLEAPAERYFSGGSQCLLNGIEAPGNKFGGPEWVGMEGKDFSAVIDLGQEQLVKSLLFQLYHDPGSWIHRPSEINIYTSEDGMTYSELVKYQISETKTGHLQPEIPLHHKSARFIKILVKNQGKIPELYPGAGKNAWLFIGEIQIKK